MWAFLRFPGFGSIRPPPQQQTGNHTQWRASESGEGQDYLKVLLFGGEMVGISWGCELVSGLAESGDA